ncbi:amino acid adenylation domain-containing protein, partial [Williamsia sp.]|uniref:amino acid adenylation domain-containing protein n=1 Tax=Williamsia sp. TaxID=1872085 RepID=UPI001A25B39C
MPSDAFELSAAQRGIWFAQQALGSIPINIAEYVELLGPIDLEVLTAATNMAGREAGSGFLRLIATGDMPMQHVDAATDDSIDTVDFSGEPDPRARALEWMRAEYSAPIDIIDDRLVITCLIRLGPDHHLWFWRAHHIVMDGFGATAMLARVTELYVAMKRGDELPPARGAKLTELVDGEQVYRSSTRFSKDREYWSEQNAGLPAAISLSPRREPPGEFSRVVSQELSERVDDLLAQVARDNLGSSAPAVIAAFAVYLGRMADTDDVVLSLPVSARNTAKLRNAAGMVSNVVPLRLAVSDSATVTELITAAQTGLAGALRRQLYRHEDMRRDIGQGTGERGLFGPSVNLMMFQSTLDLGDVVGHVNVLTTGPVEDLAINIYPGAQDKRLRIDLEANPRLYDDEDLARHLARFTELLEQMLTVDRDTAVGALTVGSAAEIDTVTRVWNATDHPVAATTLAALWRAQAERTPDATALWFGDDAMTYAEFGDRVARLARLLIEHGVGPETHVALAMRRSFDLLVGMYAVIEAGGAYVPLDVDNPGERIVSVLQSSRPRVVLTTDRDAFEVPEVESLETTVLALDRLDLTAYPSEPVTDAERVLPLRPDNTAYVIYTSGSTGRPKGVAVSHRSIVNRLEWMQAQYPLAADDVVMQKTPVTFDVSVWEFFWATQRGASIAIAAPEGHRDPEYLQTLIAARAVTTIHFVPSMLAVFVEAVSAESLTSLRRVFASGEALAPTTAARLASLVDVGIHNLYGPTEAAVDVTYHRYRPEDVDSVPIGAPVWNTRAYVLDRALRPCVVGAVGELYLGGVQLARGYVADPRQTSGRFLASPHGAPGERMYRTGDLVRWTIDGSLEYLGRSDFQVKVRGLRIELGEIEAAVRTDDAVRETVVTVHESAHGQRLVAYVVPATGREIDTASIITAVRAAVPGYMVPDAVVALDAMPLGATGKVDRRALPTPDFAAHTAVFRPPTTDRERAVVGLVEDLLGRTGVGLDDSFFGLGGDSIMSIQLVSRARAAGLHFSSREVFEHKTIGELAAAARDDAAATVLVELPGGGVGEVDPTPIVRAMAQVPAAVAAFSQSVLVPLPQPFSAEVLRAAVDAVRARHDILRSRLRVDDLGAVHHVVDSMDDAVAPVFSETSVTASPGTTEFAEAMASAARAATDRLDPGAGSVLEFVVVTGPWEGEHARRLIIVAH